MTSSEPKDARAQTDRELRAERVRTDELIDRAASKAVDEAVQRERARSGASPALLAIISDGRRHADDALLAQHGDADSAVVHDREVRWRAAVQLLKAERDRTDSTLAAERSLTDHVISARDETLGLISHDLRSHLNLLSLKVSEIIERHSRDGQLVAGLDVMQRTVVRMEKLVSDLLDFAAMESGSLRIERRTVDLVALVAEEVDAHVPAADSSGVQLRVDSDDTPIRADIDPVRISRVLMNLLTNAIKFTPHGGLITVGVRFDGGDADISVTDSGPGIAADDLESVFERFRRVDRGSQSGHGLGLYISRALVRAHGGRIWAESARGEGSTFRVRLPVRVE